MCVCVFSTEKSLELPVLTDFLSNGQTLISGIAKKALFSTHDTFLGLSFNRQTNVAYIIQYVYVDPGNRYVSC